MSLIVCKWHHAVVLLIVCGFFLPGCGGSPNKVVGESNGWTLEQYKQAIAEQDNESGQASNVAKTKNK